MDHVRVDLKNCYGIKSLAHNFDFTSVPAFAIYAPNGVMKSSLAQTFKDIANGVPSTDRIFQTRATVRKVVDKIGKDLNKDTLLVVGPYDETLSPSAKTSTLLINPQLKGEYDRLLADIEKASAALLAAITKLSKSKKDIEDEIINTYAPGRDLEVSLNRIRRELEEQLDAPFSDVLYDKIFDNRVLEAINDDGVKTTIAEYGKRYNEMLANSTFFKKGTFDYYNAKQIATSLTNNGFFKASHSVKLNSLGESVEIKTRKDLEDVISREKDAIIKDKELRARFDAVQTALDKNATLREFGSYMLDHEEYLAQLSNIPKFRQDIILSYLKANEDLYNALMNAFDAAKTARAGIEEQAKKEQTQWKEVIDIFNRRFVVPFELEAKNQIALVLGQTNVIDLGFTYHDGGEQIEIGRDELLRALSTGERKAYYILNVIFEIQARQKANQETLIVVDDIADSFDYQNKYAIIQYLKDISDSGMFKLIIMTHNFDFFRTIESRFVGYPRCLIASKSDTGLALVQAKGIRNVFANDWKGAFFTDPRKKIASIPFLRNLIEMTIGESDQSYQRLTAMLHWKKDTDSISVGELDQIFNIMCQTQKQSKNPSRLLAELIDEEAQKCLGVSAGLNLENKIVLAIAIRLAAERFMIRKIADPAFVEKIEENQTQKLTSEFRKKFSGEAVEHRHP